MRKRKKKLRQIDLEPHEWRVITDKPAREPFFGPNWRVLPYTLIIIAISIWLNINLGPWILLFLRPVL
jgi:hypothetical protein